jgi:serine/threonine-protein kinase ATR
MELFLSAIDLPVLDHTFFKSLAVSFAETSRQVHDFLVSPTCISTDARRARAISRLVLAASTGLQSLPPYNAIADPMRLHLLVRRLSDGPSDAWESSDKLLAAAFSAPFSRPILRADAISVLALLRQEQWGEHGGQLRVSLYNLPTRSIIR